MTGVFVSYSRNDAREAGDIVNRLEARGITCWIDRNSILGGNDYRSSIADGIDECSVFLLLLSKASSASQNVYDEVGAAADRRKIIIPVRLENILPAGGLGLTISRYQFVDLFQDYEREIGRLADRIAQLDLAVSNPELPVQPVSSAAQHSPLVPHLSGRIRRRWLCGSAAIFILLICLGFALLEFNRGPHSSTDSSKQERAGVAPVILHPPTAQAPTNPGEPAMRDTARQTPVLPEPLQQAAPIQSAQPRAGLFIPSGDTAESRLVLDRIRLGLITGAVALATEQHSAVRSLSMQSLRLGPPQSNALVGIASVTLRASAIIQVIPGGQVITREAVGEASNEVAATEAALASLSDRLVASLLQALR